uniref:hypothetical protein n=1 Tax=Klebsiella pneumoniae TaxID=573 RepID=UPI00222FF3B6
VGNHVVVCPRQLRDIGQFLLPAPGANCRWRPDFTIGAYAAGAVVPAKTSAADVLALNPEYAAGLPPGTSAPRKSAPAACRTHSWWFNDQKDVSSLLLAGSTLRRFWRAAGHYRRNVGVHRV